MKTGNVMIGAIGAIGLKKGEYMPDRQKKILQALIDKNLMAGGTKLIQFQLSKIDSNKYEYKRYERYKKASREFSAMPEDQIVKWHYEGKGSFTIK